MNKNNDKTLLLIAGSALLILSGIVITTFINNSQSSRGDIRAKASVETGAKYQATIGQINQDAGTIIVTNMTPESSPENNFGQWTITVPSGYAFASMPVGSIVTITADSKTFNITTHTMTAKQIVKK